MWGFSVICATAVAQLHLSGRVLVLVQQYVLLYVASLTASVVRVSCFHMFYEYNATAVSCIALSYGPEYHTGMCPFTQRGFSALH